ncbi:hypothetical protein DSL72_007308 [Monilinia vaccinii-corymbosi]|uniref:Cyanovirin-N domain-containing protein n=1 Tax=Monilinia vaccinii-corymbosi TaxID=61207 RepID=A0A8A3PMG8_9HELO|nr:hypothetical protein DSL72_007308 [Monilinia vaccinii-corymbosi]
MVQLSFPIALVSILASLTSAQESSGFLSNGNCDGNSLRFDDDRNSPWYQYLSALCKTDEGPKRKSIKLTNCIGDHDGQLAWDTARPNFHLNCDSPCKVVVDYRSPEEAFLACSRCKRNKPNTYFTQPQIRLNGGISYNNGALFCY